MYLHFKVNFMPYGELDFDDEDLGPSLFMASYLACMISSGIFLIGWRGNSGGFSAYHGMWSHRSRLIEGACWVNTRSITMHRGGFGTPLACIPFHWMSWARRPSIRTSAMMTTWTGTKRFHIVLYLHRGRLLYGLVNNVFFKQKTILQWTYLF